MAHENRFITSGGTSIWFAAGGSAPNVEWNGTSPATPWTSQSTTPFAIAMNDVTGQRWTPTEASATDVYAGRIPIPRSPQNYANVQDAIPIQIRGTTQDVMIAALRLLKQELRTVSYSTPALFVFDPDGQTNAGYTEVYGADVGVHPYFINDENGRKVLRAVITMTRAPFFSNLASGVTALSSGNHTNQAGSNTRNLPTTPNGDLTYEGQPLNIRITGTGGTTKYISTLMMASIAASASNTTGAGSISGASTTSSKMSTGFPSGSYSALYAAITGNERTRLRVLQRFSSVTAFSVVQVSIPSIGYSSRITLNSTDRVVDYGDFLPEPQRWRSTDLGIYLYLISGGPLTLVNTEVLAYYDFAKTVSTPDFETTTSSYADITGFRAASNRATLPLDAPTLTYYDPNASLGVQGARQYYGTLPRLYPNSKLWLAWTTTSTVDGSANTAFTETLSTAATYAPLFLSFRGNT